jgi:hypothetical protein
MGRKATPAVESISSMRVRKFDGKTTTVCLRIDESERAAEFRVAMLEAILFMKLTSYRLKDGVHILDMIGVGLIDATWPARFPAPLRDRLQQLLDNPDG